MNICVLNERKCGLYIDLLMTVRYSHEVWGRVVSVSVHGEQTQSCLLEKTHQSNGNLRKNDSFLMPKGEFKLAPNPNPSQLGSVRGGAAAACARVWAEPSMS